MMKRVDPDMPIGKLTRVKNFLPPPSELVFPIEKVRVTISLSRPSVDFFKKQADKYHTKYQKMIREVLDRYTEQHLQSH